MPQFVEIKFPRSAALKFFDFMGGFGLQVIIGNAVALSGKNLPQMLTGIMGGTWAHRVGDFLGGITTSANAKVGENVVYYLTKENEKDKEILRDRLKEQAEELGIEDEQIEKLINNQWPQAKGLFADDHNLTPEKLATFVKGISYDEAAIMLDVASRGYKFLLKIENANVVGIILGGVATMVFPFPLPTNQFLAQMTQAGIGYAVAKTVEFATHSAQSKFSQSYWAPKNESSKASEEEESLLNSAPGEGSAPGQEF